MAVVEQLHFVGEIGIEIAPGIVVVANGGATGSAAVASAIEFEAVTAAAMVIVGAYVAAVVVIEGA